MITKITHWCVIKDVCDFHLHHVHCRSLLLITIFSAVITEFKPSTRNSARTSDTFPVSSNQFNMYDNRPFYSCLLSCQAFDLE